MDLFPTLLRLAGTEPPDDRPIDGVDVWPVLTGGSSPRSEYLFYASNSDSIVRVMAIRSGPWKLHFEWQPAGEFSPNGLYHLEQDPGEAVDRAGNEPGIVQRLAARARVIASGVRPGKLCPPLPMELRHRPKKT
jgi:arylsulfatase A-like enzyme